MDSETFRLMYECSMTERTKGYGNTPVPIGDKLFFDCKSETGVGNSLRSFFHKALDEWLNSVSTNPDQFGSRMKCGFAIEYRGTDDSWMTIEEEQAVTAKETVRQRLSEIVSIANGGAM
jgi:hypothetical protein